MNDPDKTEYAVVSEGRTNLTYRELLEELSDLDGERLDQHVTVHIADEYYPVIATGVAVEDDVLDKDHLVLVVE